MGREKKAKSPAEKPGNVTHEKLSEVPFNSAKALKDAQDQVRMMVWRRMEEAKVIAEMIQKPEYSFWKEEFSEGLVCSYGEKGDHNLVRVFSDGKGVRILINRSLAEGAPSSETVLGTLVKAMSESFAGTYYKAKGILPIDGIFEDKPKIPGT